MSKCFNTAGDCKPALHYMVDVESRLVAMKKLVDSHAYFTINRARQYGKTTTLRALARFLENDYIVVSLDFQGFSTTNFETEREFVITFIEELLCACNDMMLDIKNEFKILVELENANLYKLFKVLTKWCEQSNRPIILLIDEVDSASNHQVFLDFLSQLRRYYLNRDVSATFQAVILAGVYDIKNIKMKLQQDESRNMNSPWNIATDFDLDMSFSEKDIEGMLLEYEKDNHTGMDIGEMGQLIYDYTSGYPFLVSYLCKTLDEKIAVREGKIDKKFAWTKTGFLKAMKILLEDNNTLFESLIHKLYDYPNIRKLIYMVLFSGRTIPYNARNIEIDVAKMFGFIKNQNGMTVISNRVFETILYEQLIGDEIIDNEAYSVALRDKNQFIENGKLKMELILQKFIEYFSDIFGEKTNAFLEEEGRKYFLLFLKPIINGVGNYYIESQTRDMKRTDIIIDYLGTQYIVEMKIWHGEEYNKRGEVQLAEYLDYYRVNKGYMLSFNFNKNKNIGIKHIELNGKLLIEGVV